MRERATPHRGSRGMTYTTVAIWLFGFFVGFALGVILMIGYLRRQLRRWTHPAEKPRWYYRPTEDE